MPKPSSNPSVFHEPWMSSPAPMPAGKGRPASGDDFADPDNPYAQPMVKAPAISPGEDIWNEPAIGFPDRPGGPPPPASGGSWLDGIRALWRSLIGFSEPEQLPRDPGLR